MKVRKKLFAWGYIVFLVLVVVVGAVIGFVPKMTTSQRIPESISLQNPELKGASPLDFMEVNLKLENGIQIEQGKTKQKIYELSFEFLNEEITDAIVLISEDVEIVFLSDTLAEGDCLYDAVASNGKTGEVTYIYTEEVQEVNGKGRTWEISLEDLKKNRYGIRYQIDKDELPTVPLYFYVCRNFTHGGYDTFEAELDIEADTSVRWMAWRKHSFSMASWAMYYPDIESLVAESELIAVVEAAGSSDKAGRTEVQVIDAVYGCESDEIFKIQQTGALIDSLRQEVYDDPLLDKGKQYLIFANRNDQGTVTILGGPQGRFCYEDGKINSLMYGVARMRLLQEPEILGIDIKDENYDNLRKQIENALETK